MTDNVNRDWSEERQFTDMEVNRDSAENEWTETFNRDECEKRHLIEMEAER